MGVVQRASNQPPTISSSKKKGDKFRDVDDKFCFRAHIFYLPAMRAFNIEKFHVCVEIETLNHIIFAGDFYWRY